MNMCLSLAKCRGFVYAKPLTFVAILLVVR